MEISTIESHWGSYNVGIDCHNVVPSVGDKEGGAKINYDNWVLHKLFTKQWVCLSLYETLFKEYM